MISNCIEKAEKWEILKKNHHFYIVSKIKFLTAFWDLNLNFCSQLQEFFKFKFISYVNFFKNLENAFLTQMHRQSIQTSFKSTLWEPLQCNDIGIRKKSSYFHSLNIFPCIQKKNQRIKFSFSISIFSTIAQR